MTCQQFQRRIFDCLDNQLSSAERPAVAAHLAGCADCAAWAQQLSRLDAALTRVVQIPALGPDFCARVSQRIQTEGLLLSENERAERRRELRTEFETRLIELRRASFRSVSLMESLGWVVLAAWAVWLLSTVGLAWIKPMVEPGPGSFPGTLLPLLTASGVFVLIGLSAAFPRQFTRLWAES
jgi:anti-sigma factor RsiW